MCSLWCRRKIESAIIGGRASRFEVADMRRRLTVTLVNLSPVANVLCILDTALCRDAATCRAICGADCRLVNFPGPVSTIRRTERELMTFVRYITLLNTCSNASSRNNHYSSLLCPLSTWYGWRHNDFVLFVRLEHC